MTGNCPVRFGGRETRVLFGGTRLPTQSTFPGSQFRWDNWSKKLKKSTSGFSSGVPNRILNCIAAVKGQNQSASCSERVQNTASHSRIRHLTKPSGCLLWNPRWNPKINGGSCSGPVMMRNYLKIRGCGERI